MGSVKFPGCISYQGSLLCQWELLVLGPWSKSLGWKWFTYMTSTSTGGGSLKCWVSPTTMGFPTKTDDFGV